MLKFSTIAVSAFFLLIRLSFAAPCCSSSAAAPSIVSGDDQAQMTFTTSRSSVIGDAPNEGRAVFRSADDSETTQVYRLDYAKVIADRYQAGVSLPLVAHSVDKPSTQAQATRVGDIRLTAAYEALPEWSYSAWKPKGFVFLQAAIPTGRSIYDAREAGFVDATGRGFYTLSTGALLTKTKGAWDFYSMPEIHYSVPREFDATATSESVRISPRLGFSLALGVGYSPNLGNLRLGLRLQPVFNQAKIVESNSGKTETGMQQTWDTSLELGYLLDEMWTVLSTYSDQTLLGPAKNSTLSRTFALGLQHRWSR